MVQLGSVVVVDPVRWCLESGVHPDFNARNIHADYFPDGKIWVRCTFKDDGTLSSNRQRHPDVPCVRRLDSETDLHAWARSLYGFLEAVKRIA